MRPLATYRTAPQARPLGQRAQDRTLAFRLQARPRGSTSGVVYVRDGCLKGLPKVGALLQRFEVSVRHKDEFPMELMEQFLDNARSIHRLFLAGDLPKKRKLIQRSCDTLTD